MASLMDNNKKIILAGGVLVIFGVASFFFGRSQEQKVQVPPVEQAATQEILPPVETVNQVTDKSIQLYATQSGEVALDLLESETSVVYKESEMGVFINSINDLKGNKENYWAIYVNDEYATSSADTTVLNQGDMVEFRYEQIDTTQF